MEASVQAFDFPYVREGNTCKQITFKLPELDIFYLPGANIYMQVRKKPGQVVIAEFSTKNGKLEILTDYWFKFSSQVITIPTDSYTYDILFVFADGRRRTYIGGKWTIGPVTTKKTT